MLRHLCTDCLFGTQVDDVLGNLTTSVNTLRKQIVGLEGEQDDVESGTSNTTSTWNQEYFKYIGLILLLPRYCRASNTYMRHSEYEALLFTKVCNYYVLLFMVLIFLIYSHRLTGSFLVMINLW